MPNWNKEWTQDTVWLFPLIQMIWLLLHQSIFRKSYISYVSEPDMSSTSITPLEWWKFLQMNFLSFQKRWHSDNLSQFQQQAKWSKSKLKLKLNDIVLVKGGTYFPLRWILGWIMELFMLKITMSIWWS